MEVTGSWRSLVHGGHGGHGVMEVTGLGGHGVTVSRGTRESLRGLTTGNFRADAVFNDTDT
jgi:hypothetical protein